MPRNPYIDRLMVARRYMVLVQESVDISIRNHDQAEIFVCQKLMQTAQRGLKNMVRDLFYEYENAGGF